MGDVKWTGNAASIKDIWKLVIGGTYAAADTLEWTIGSRKLKVTIGSEITLPNILTALCNAWNQSQRLDGLTSPNSTSNFGGNECGEYAELFASNDGATTMWLTGKVPGKPIALAIAVVSTSGTHALTNPQAATGQNHYDNVKNWSTGAVPGNVDRMVLENNGTSILYNLPTGGKLPTIYQYASWTGVIGLPEINRDNPNLPYYEYRARAAVFDDTTVTGGDDGNRFHAFGVGDGGGSPFINVEISNVTLGVSSVDVHSTSTTPLETFGKCLNIKLVNFYDGLEPDFSGYLNVVNGSVDVKSGSIFRSMTLAASESCKVVITNPTPVTGLRLTTAEKSHLTVRQTDFTQQIVLNVSCLGGTVVIEDVSLDVADSSLTCGIQNGTVVWNTDGSWSFMTLVGHGVLDCEKDMRPFDGNAISMSQGSAFLDQYGRSGTVIIQPQGCSIGDVTIRAGQSKWATVADPP